MEALLNKRNTVLLLGALTVWRLWLAGALQLHPDEAYYWLWSRQLQAAYFDHPPLVAYVIRLTTLVAGGELGVRLAGPLVALLVSALIWRIAFGLYGSSQVAAGSVLLFNAYPMSLLGLVVITPDIPLFFFATLSGYLFWRCVRGGPPWAWSALGAAWGLALLSKYTAVLLLPCAFAYLALSEDRRWLKTPSPYRALLVALLCFVPVLYWNSQHQWVSFAFQLRHGLAGEAPSLGHVLEYFAGQMLLVGPLAWLLGLRAAFAGGWRRDKARVFLIAASIPVIAFFGLTSFWATAGPNWPAFAYAGFSILATRYGLDGTSAVRRRMWLGALVSSFALAAAAALQAQFGVIPLERLSPRLAAADATNAFYGWREFGAELKAYPGSPVVLTPSHQLSAEIAYYTDSHIPTWPEPGARPSQFNLWPWPQRFHGDHTLRVWLDGDAPPANLAPAAGNRTMTVYRDGHVLRRYHLVHCGQPSPAGLPDTRGTACQAPPSQSAR